MDLNIKIIEGVKQFPCLYDNNRSIEERNHAWMQLSDKLDLNAQILKVRWHSLLQGYQRDVNYKYANRMRFVHRRTESSSKENWPEFIITEEYLKYDNGDQQEQFVFLDTEEDDNKPESLKSSKESECHIKEVPKQIGKALKKECDKNEQGGSDRKVVKDKVDPSSKPSEEQNKDVEVIFSHEPKEIHDSNATISNVEERMAEVDVNKSNGTCVENVYEKSQPLIVERCEDVIFGELVSAMLKRMDDNKKKSIKREIMNLLFS